MNVTFLIFQELLNEISKLQSRLDEAAHDLITAVEKGSNDVTRGAVVTDRPVLPDVQILRQRLNCAQHDAEVQHAELEKATDLSHALNAKLQAASSRADHVTKELAVGNAPPTFASLDEARETLNKQKVSVAVCLRILINCIASD